MPLVPAELCSGRNPIKKPRSPPPSSPPAPFLPVLAPPDSPCCFRYCRMETFCGRTLPPGFGFHPTDGELISHYLKRKILGKKIEYELIPEVDIYKHEPWDLPEKCNVPTKDTKWHFFTRPDKKYPNGFRSNRATRAGYWKSTGKDRTIKVNKRTVGTKKTLVFHQGRPATGKRTEWIMHEYYIDGNECQASPDMKDAFVLCRVTKRNGWTSDDDNEEGNNDFHPQQPNDAAGSVLSAQPATANEDLQPWLDDLQPWLEDLLEPSPDFSSNLIFPGPSLDGQNAVSSNLPDFAVLAPKVEPEYASPNQNVADDTDYLLADDILAILNPGTDDFSTSISSIFQDTAEQAALGPMEMNTFTLPNNSVDESQKELQLRLENNGFSLSYGHDQDTGVIVRRREVTKSTTSASTSTGRVKLQVGINKMVVNNAESINRTIKFVDNRGHLDIVTNVEHQNKQVRDVTLVQQSDTANVASESEKSLIKSSVHADNSRELCDMGDNTSCIKGFMRSLLMVVRGCSSAGLNFLFVTACIIGAAAAILYFLLRDGRRYVGGSQFVGL